MYNIKRRRHKREYLAKFLVSENQSKGKYLNEFDWNKFLPVIHKKRHFHLNLVEGMFFNFLTFFFFKANYPCILLQTYEKGVYPPPPPGRTAASGAEVHHPPISEERHYVPYPPGTSSKPSPALSTFNPNMQGTGSPHHSTPNQCNHMSPADGVVVHNEMDGHLV